jgi:ribosome-dependent ATPase
MIEVEHLSKTYGSTAAIADVSFSVESGEILGFLGPNGAGKTTTMRILSGYLPASSGTARIAGLDVHENSMGVRQRIGYLPENPPLYPEMSVEGFLFFVARIKQVSAGDIAQRVTSAIERCGLVEKRKVLIRKLSKGFKQRVGIAQAIVHDPPVIILDEPTVGLDPRQIIEVRNLIKSLGGQHTIILSTHILPEVSMTCNRVTIINRGKIVAAGTPDNLMGELAAGEGYELEVEGEADLLESLLLPSVENLPGVRSVELIPNQQFLANRYRLRALCESDIEPGREIAAAIIASGFGLCEMRRNRATLEDVFLRLTAAENKPEETLIHTEPEVDRNLQEAAQTPDSILDSDRLESPLIVDDSPVSDREESPYDSHQSASEPVAEIRESIELPESEPVAEIRESIELPESEPVAEIRESIELPESEPVAEIRESIELPESEPVAEIVEPIELPESEPVAEIVEPIELPESEPVAETPETISDLEPELQSVAHFLEIAERQESIELPQPETVEPIELPQPETVVETVELIELPQPETVVETRESIELPQPETVESIELPQPETVVETVESIELPQPETVESIELPQPETVVETVESIELPQPETVESIELPQSETVVEKVESIELPQPETVVETVELIELPQPETVVETPESIELPQPETLPVVRNRQAKKTQQPSSDPSVEQPPLTKKRQIQRKQQDSDDSTTPPTGDSANDQ